MKDFINLLKMNKISTLLCGAIFEDKKIEATQ